MQRFRPETGRRLASTGRLAISAVLLIFLWMLSAAGAVSAAPAPQQQGPECQSCHPGEYDVWKSSKHAGAGLDPVFQEQLAKAHNQDECLTCHTTGVETGDGCQACHGTYQAGHPSSATMKLPVQSDAMCRTCHEAAYSGWEKSAHAEKEIECFDCHLAHTQGVRTGSVDTLCAACHSDQGTPAAHSRHGINGVNCTSCHMAKQMTATAAGEGGAQISASSHSFKVAADVCAQCHGSTIHATGGAKAPGNLQVFATVEGQAQPAAEKGFAELRAEIISLQKRLTALRDAAVIGIGLAFGVGGFMGLVVGLAGVGLWRRNRGAA
jgi:hypothetical protein